MLMPPDLTDWVLDDHLVWSILGAVEQMDLSAFYGVYRENGQGRAAYEPSMMVALLVYAYARGNRSSRGIERECREDVVYKLITAMRVPDHSTIAEFRRRHERAIAELFSSVLELCGEAGLVEVGVISIDGTKIRANASRGANRTYEKLVADILKEAEETDRWEDGLFGDDRGDEPPEHLRTEEGRRAAFEAAKERLAAKAGRGEESEVAGFELDPEFSATGKGRRAWHREDAKSLCVNASRMRTDGQPTVQGYNAQAAVTRGQIIVAAEITVESPDFGHLEPVVNATLRELAAAGMTERPQTVLADAGYWHKGADAEHRQRRHPGPGLTRRWPAERHQARMGQRHVFVHAPGTRQRGGRQRGGPRALQAPKSDRRAGVRAGQVQPQDQPIPTPRPRRRVIGMATGRGHAQPAQAPQPLDHTPHRLTRERGHRRPPADSGPSPAPPATRRSPQPLPDSHRQEQNTPNRPPSACSGRPPAVETARPQTAGHEEVTTAAAPRAVPGAAASTAASVISRRAPVAGCGRPERGLTRLDASC